MLLSLLALAAHAADPIQLPLQGALTDANGQPLEGAGALDVALLDGPAGAERWREDGVVAQFTGGVFSLSSRVTTSSGRSKAPPKPASICVYSGLPVPAGGCGTGVAGRAQGAGFL